VTVNSETGNSDNRNTKTGNGKTENNDTRNTKLTTAKQLIVKLEKVPLEIVTGNSGFVNNKNGNSYITNS
jgi:hypothetical protein